MLIDACYWQAHKRANIEMLTEIEVENEAGQGNYSTRRK
jgi:hypothetical protein